MHYGLRWAEAQRQQVQAWSAEELTCGAYINVVQRILAELRRRVSSSESDTQRVSRGEQITALRILKWRKDHAGGNKPPVEISVLAQGDKKAMSTYAFDMAT